MRYVIFGLISLIDLIVILAGRASVLVSPQASLLIVIVFFLFGPQWTSAQPSSLGGAPNGGVENQPLLIPGHQSSDPLQGGLIKPADPRTLPPLDDNLGLATLRGRMLPGASAKKITSICGGGRSGKALAPKRETPS